MVSKRRVVRVVTELGRWQWKEWRVSERGSGIVICEWKFVGEGRGRAGDGKDGVGCSVASGDMDSGHSAEGAGESSGRP
jgi:hypothetical protein